jgi:hypothetical protein
MCMSVVQKGLLMEHGATAWSICFYYGMDMTCSPHCNDPSIACFFIYPLELLPDKFRNKLSRHHLNEV